MASPEADRLLASTKFLGFIGGMSDDQMSAILLTILPRVVAVDSQGDWLRRKLQ